MASTFQCSAFLTVQLSGLQLSVISPAFPYIPWPTSPHILHNIDFSKAKGILSWRPLHMFFSLPRICLKRDLFIFWLWWVFLAACGLSLAVVSGGYSSLWCEGFSLQGLLLLRSTGFTARGLRSNGSQALAQDQWLCGAQALLICGMWDRPGAGNEPVSPALARRFLTIKHQGSPSNTFSHSSPSSYFCLVQFSSVAQSCQTLQPHGLCSTPGLPVHHRLLELTQTYVHWVSDAI